ncbi:hypothetical protein V1264_016512 [Littorina saxatilis]|uniref:Chitin-binding type-4 domain-containing protein n=2 Tax=Littorina saxatilis TaxID=31220 RepID=A0AAN9BSI1_9CAEN
MGFIHGITALFVLLSCVLQSANGHGRLLEPPGRSSMWRVGFNTPKNYNDNALYCGGFANQYAIQGGKCGICGDPYQGPRDNEAGGKYATGTIGRKYSQGQTIDVTVEVTANHLGWFEFKLCPNNNPKKEATQDCLDRHVLQVADGSGSKLLIGTTLGKTDFKLRLPADVTCSQCVLQWRYHTGNSYGQGADGKSCPGCGDQEEFYSCSDIEINPASGQQQQRPPAILPHVDVPQTNLGVPQGNSFVPQGNGVIPPQTSFQGGGNPVVSSGHSQSSGTDGFNFIPLGNSAGQGNSGVGQGKSSVGQGGGVIGQGSGTQQVVGLLKCRAISPLWRGQPQLDSWCQYNCLKANNCPSSLCSCL